MKLYFAESGNKERNRIMYNLNCSRLFSYFIIIDPNSGYGEGERFVELTEKLKHESISGRAISKSERIRKEKNKKV